MASEEETADWHTLGDYIRAQRELARLSIRQMAALAKISNPYLSQIERGVYKPSAEVLKSIARALDLSAETLYEQAGLLDEESRERMPRVEEAIRLDPRLSTEQKQALITVYRQFAGE
jgi:transcriptional regulator with XRE-family HTH domain